MLPDLTLQVPQRELTRGEVSAAMSALLDASVGDESKATFLRAWAQRGESAAEMAACAETLLPLAVDPGVRGSWNGKPLLDCCGTGGGGLNLINISTGLVFILAAMGIPVVKHGNRGITKKSGSADVLEALRIKIDLQPNQVEACLEKVGAAFLFAPAYHTTFASIAPVRKKLAAEGQRTIFNLLGPLLNPARPDSRLVGVFKNEHVDLYKAALEKMNCSRFTVACGEYKNFGTMLGEVSPLGCTSTGSTLVLPDGTSLVFLISEVNAHFHQLMSSYYRSGYPIGTAGKSGEPHPRADEMADRLYEALDLVSDTDTIISLCVQDAQESAQRLVAILSNEEIGLGRETLLVNAAMAAWTHGTVESFVEGWDMARETLESGRALERLRAWQEFSAKL